MSICERVHARVGLLGNPSDGYYGCCISFSLSNFWAEVALTPSARLHFEPNPVQDSTDYDGLQQLVDKLDTCGYYGGVRLLQAQVKVFYEWCRGQGINLPQDRNFTLSYDTNIPRQAGLSALNCLLKHYGVGDRVPLELRPNLVLAAEKELGIVAGLQDRVIQVYGGLVYMDFDEAGMQQRGHGDYQRMDADLLLLDGRPPVNAPLVLAGACRLLACLSQPLTAKPLSLDGRPGLLHVMYADNPSDSGRVHADVRQRWLQGDAQVCADMAEVAECARKGRVALELRDVTALAALMNRNFDLRRKMFGDQALGSQNLRMIELARSVGAAAKFTGSGGAVLVLCPDGEEQAQRLSELATGLGFKMVAVIGPQT